LENPNPTLKVPACPLQGTPRRAIQQTETHDFIQAVLARRPCEESVGYTADVVIPAVPPHEPGLSSTRRSSSGSPCERLRTPATIKRPSGDILNAFTCCPKGAGDLTRNYKTSPRGKSFMLSQRPMGASSRDSQGRSSRSVIANDHHSCSTRPLRRQRVAMRTDLANGRNTSMHATTTSCGDTQWRLQRFVTEYKLLSIGRDSKSGFKFALYLSTWVHCR
jgi:hypothetical protein